MLVFAKNIKKQKKTSSQSYTYSTQHNRGSEKICMYVYVCIYMYMYVCSCYIVDLITANHKLNYKNIWMKGREDTTSD